MNTTNYIAKKYIDLFNFTANAIQKSPNVVIGENANTLAKRVTLFHFIRASYLLDAIYRLCSEGFATEAMVVLRSLLNLLINLKWLTSDGSKFRFERYADFEVIFKKLTMEDVIEYGDIWEDIKNDNLSVHNKDFQRLKKKYHLKKRNDFFNWSGKSIYQMAKDKNVNMEKDYKIIYGRLSAIEHTGPDSVRDYLYNSEKGITKIKAGPRDKNIDLVLITSLEYFFKVKAITHNIFGVDWTNLEKDRQKFLDLRNKYWASNHNQV